MKPEELVKETDNGVRVHQFSGLKLDADAISFSVTDSILAGKYIDSSGTSAGTTTELTVDTSVNASKIAGIYNLHAGETVSNGKLTISGVTLGDEKHAVNLYGGYSETGLVKGNQVTINSSTVSGTVYGGYNGIGGVYQNHVTINSGTVPGMVYGGRSETGLADNNTVTISGGTVSSRVYGGYSGAHSASNNKVTISGGTVSGRVYGGYSFGDEIGNTVIISGGTVTSTVYGGYGKTGAVSNNKVTISGGTVTGTVYAGYAQIGEASDNTVTIQGNENSKINLSQADLRGKNDGAEGSGNTLVFDNWGGTIQSIKNFDAITVKNLVVNNDGGLVIVDSADSDLSTLTDFSGSITLSDSLDKAAGDTIDIIKGVTNESFLNAGNTFAANLTDSVVETDNGVRVHTFGDAAATKDSLSVTVKDSILAGTYIDSDGNSAGTTTALTVTSSVNASEIAGIYSLNGGAAGGTLTIKGVSLGSETNTIEFYGGYSNSAMGSMTESTVTIEGEADVIGTVYGGSAESSAVKNAVIMNNSWVSGEVYGGYSAGSAASNTVTISGGAVAGNAVGGYGESGASNNAVIITGGGTVVGDALGGYSKSGTAEENHVTISGGTVHGHVLGGYGKKGASNNEVAITGGAVNGDVYAGYADEGTVTKNTLTIQGNKGGQMDLSQANLYGKNDSAEGSGNTLTFDGWGGKVGSIKNFDAITIKNLVVNNDGGLVIVDSEDSDLSTLTDFNGSITLSENLDKAAGDTIDIIKGVTNESFLNAGNTFAANLTNSVVETDNGVRVHTFGDAAATKDGVSVTVKDSILAGVYTEGGKTYGTGELVIGEDFTTKANITAGAYGADTANADGGSVLVTGTVSGYLYGGFSEEGTASNNTITLKEGADVSAAHLIGGCSGSEDAEASAGIAAASVRSGGNALVLDGWTGSVERISDFDTLSILNQTWNTGGTILTITHAEENDLANTTLELGTMSFAGGAALEKGDAMTILTAANGVNLGLTADSISDKGFTAGIAAVGEGVLSVDENGNIRYELTEIKANSQIQLAADNRAVGAAFLNQGGDLAAEALSANANNVEGTDTFGAVSGTYSKYAVNDDLKVNGWNMLAGVNQTKEMGAGWLIYGAFYENGTANYRTYNQFEGETFRGDGSLNYTGGGLAVRYEREDGWHGEATLRGGVLKSSMSDAFRDGAGKSYGYSSDSDYYGFHVGIGKTKQLSDTRALDLYGAYFHTYAEGDSVTVANDTLDFDSIHSDRLRLGARLTGQKNETWSWYGGLAWEYEFSGDADMTANAWRMPEASLQGSTFLTELGLQYRPQESPWSVSLNVKGYLGEREGGSASVQVGYAF